MKPDVSAWMIWKLKPEVQNAVESIWNDVTSENLNTLTDFKGYQKDFLKLFGFGFSSVDYEAPVDLHLR